MPLVPVERHLPGARILVGERARERLARVAGVAPCHLPGVVQRPAEEPRLKLSQGDREPDDVAEVDVGEAGILGIGVGADELHSQEVPDVLVEQAHVQPQPLVQRVLVAELVLDGLLGLEVRVAEHSELARVVGLQPRQDRVVGVGEDVPQSGELVEVAVREEERGAVRDRIRDADPRSQPNLGRGRPRNRLRRAGDGIGRVLKIARHRRPGIEVLEPEPRAQVEIVPLQLFLPEGCALERKIFADPGEVGRLVQVAHQLLLARLGHEGQMPGRAERDLGQLELRSDLELLVLPDLAGERALDDQRVGLLQKAAEIHALQIDPGQTLIVARRSGRVVARVEHVVVGHVLVVEVILAHAQVIDGGGSQRLRPVHAVHDRKRALAREPVRVGHEPEVGAPAAQAVEDRLVADLDVAERPVRDLRQARPFPGKSEWNLRAVSVRVVHLDS